jgi:uncharacterized protein DUF262/uncharacterized protein DUF1524
MREILGKAKTIRELLKGVKYSIDYYQREYKWQDKQVRELLDDLSNKFLEDYRPQHSRKEVAGYPHYFLGSIIISKKDGASFVVDGQQRLTSLTLLLIYLRNLQKKRADKVNLDELIVSERFGEVSFNLEVPERAPWMKAPYDEVSFDETDQPESVQNLKHRFADIEEEFPEELRGHALPYFVDWLLENVHLVEITAYSDDDAYTIFETMNDRGLSLSPTDMLKGYLLANIEEPGRTRAAEIWRRRLRELQAREEEDPADFFKNWLRSQYATKIRERKKGATSEDFDRIGTEFHRWLREASETIGLSRGDAFYRFVERDLDFFAKQYLRIVQASYEVTPGLEHIAYNADHGFTLQDLLLLAPLRPDDNETIVARKLSVVARYVDILLTWRIWNFRSIAYSTMQYAMFLVMRDIRGLEPVALARELHRRLESEGETFRSHSPYYKPEVGLHVHQQNRYAIHRILARLTDYVEVQSGHEPGYSKYVGDAKVRFEVEHIWADFPRRHSDEFPHPADFEEHRNRIGGLLLLPKRFNASYGGLTYEKKLPHYNTQNLLARSLHPQCYEHNPGFLQFVRSSHLPFRPHPQFGKADLDERGELYLRLADRIWDPAQLLEIGSDSTTPAG